MNNIIEKEWEQPVLTANGTMGGSTFAVSCKDFASNTSDAAARNAWEAFAADETQYWRSATSTSYIDFYNPVPIKIKKMYCRTNIGDTVTYGAPESGSVYGSDNGTDWTKITDFTNSTTGVFTVTVNSTTFYKYHRFEGTCTVNDTFLHLHFRIDAVYQQIVSLTDLSDNTDKIKKSDLAELTGNVAAVNQATGGTVSYTQPDIGVGTIINGVTWENLQTAMTSLKTMMANNCCQSNKNDCCESCQTTAQGYAGCQACQGCQTCQSCQGCQTCQSCQSCQGCQSCQK